MAAAFARVDYYLILLIKLLLVKLDSRKYFFESILIFSYLLFTGQIR